MDTSAQAPCPPRPSCPRPCSVLGPGHQSSGWCGCENLLRQTAQGVLGADSPPGPRPNPGGQCRPDTQLWPQRACLSWYRYPRARPHGQLSCRPRPTCASPQPKGTMGAGTPPPPRSCHSLGRGLAVHPRLLLAREDVPAPEPDAHSPVCTQTGQPPRCWAQAPSQYRPPAPSTPGPPRGEEGQIRCSLAAAPRPGFGEHLAKGLPEPLAAAPQPLAGGRSDRGSGKGALGGVDKVSQAPPAAGGRADAGQGST